MVLAGMRRILRTKLSQPLKADATTAVKTEDKAAPAAATIAEVAS